MALVPGIYVMQYILHSLCNKLPLGIFTVFIVPKERLIHGRKTVILATLLVGR